MREDGVGSGVLMLQPDTIYRRRGAMRKPRGIDGAGNHERLASQMSIDAGVFDLFRCSQTRQVRGLRCFKVLPSEGIRENMHALVTHNRKSICGLEVMSSM